MKKQVFSLIMVLALVVLAGTSAFAQNDGDIPTQPQVHLPGSTHEVTLTRGVASSNISWVLYTGSDATTLADASHTTTAFPVNTEDFTLVWTDLAAGAYYLQITETDDDPACAVTVRGFHLYVLGFDARVYASNAAGSEVTGASLLDCSEASNYAVFMNDLQVDIAGNARATGNDPDDDGSLTNYIGTDIRTTRYFTVEITFDAVPGGYNFSAPDLGSIVCDMATTSSSDLYSVNGDAATPASLAGQLVVENTTDNLFTIPVLHNDRWGTDITSYIDVTNIKIYTSNDGTGTSLGEEPQSYEDLNLADEATESPSYENNRSATFTIQGAPNTSVISIN